MDNDQIYKLIIDQNPWWKDSHYEPPERGWFHRPPYQEIAAKLDIPLMISLTGLRRTGKTTLLRQLLANLLEKIPDRSRFLFFSFDEEILAARSDILDSIVKVYLERVVRKNLWEIKEQVYIFFDEIQDVALWQGVLKRFYDQNKNLKFILSGSASLFIRRDSDESLAGRIFEYQVPPLPFREYLTLSKELQEITLPEIDLYHLPEVMDRVKDLSLKWGSKLQASFTRYLLRGQFPETLAMQDIRDVFKYLKESVLRKVLSVDIPKHFGIQKPEELNLLFRALSHDTAQIVEFKNIAQECALSMETISNYVDCFKECLLMDVLYNHTRSARKQLRTQKKVYIASPNFPVALFGIHEMNLFMESFMGHLVETYAYWAIKRQSDELFFARELDREIDFFARRSEKCLLIESKYSERLSPLKTLLYFMEKKKVSEGIILTPNHADTLNKAGNTIHLLPIWAL